MRPQPKEEYAIVLDFLPGGKPLSKIYIPIAQVLGEDYFTLLEVVPRRGVSLNPGDRVYIGSEKRDHIHHIVGKIRYDELTQNAKLELENVIEKLVSQNEKKFVDFFNNARPLTTRLHQLELLPGIGKKHMWKIIEEREKKPFENFEDLKKRVNFLPDPKKIVIKRILMELQNVDKYKIFVGQPR